MYSREITESWAFKEIPHSRNEAFRAFLKLLKGSSRDLSNRDKVALRPSLNIRTGMRQVFGTQQVFLKVCRNRRGLRCKFAYRAAPVPGRPPPTQGVLLGPAPALHRREPTNAVRLGAAGSLPRTGFKTSVLEKSQAFVPKHRF